MRTIACDLRFRGSDAAGSGPGRTLHEWHH